MRRFIRILIPALTVLIVWLVWPYMLSSEKQVEKRHRDLMSAASRRSWLEASEMMAADYKDQWESNREDAVTTAREILSGFIILDLEWKHDSLTVIGNTAQVQGLMHMEGKGMGVSSMVMDRVNQTKKPWTFTWRKDGWKPTDWKLISVSNEELEGLKIPRE